MTAPSATNVLDVYRSATPDQISAGLSWYDEAHSFALYLSVTYSVTLECAAGVIAAGSPMMSWGANKRNAERWISQGFADKYLSHGIRKADAIISGADPLSVLTSSKISNFYLCILSRGEHETAVCIDRHAWDVTVNEKLTDKTRPGLSSVKRYATAADAYRESAAIIGIAPAKLQAIAWVTWRNRFYREGAWDGES